jgi:isoleucyl-tRNA synthetase
MARSYVPGWDCHGLPIENKALKAVQVDVCILFNGGPGLCIILFQDHRSIAPEEIRSLANATAVQAVKSQKDEFRELGIMADWDGMSSTYRTLGKCSLGCTPVCLRSLTYSDHDYEMRQLRIFQNMVERGKPSPSLPRPAETEMLYQILSIVTIGRFITRLRHARP